MIAKDYTKIVIELEFDKNDEVTKEIILDYINTLYENGQLYIEAYDSKHNPVVIE